jgi:hypothetical protein
LDAAGHTDDHHSVEVDAHFSPTHHAGIGEAF